MSLDLFKNMCEKEGACISSTLKAERAVADLNKRLALSNFVMPEVPVSQSME